MTRGATMRGSSSFPNTASHRSIAQLISTVRCGAPAWSPSARNWAANKSDPGASAAFAVADHQIAHIYVSEKQRIAEVKALVATLPGVERVLDELRQGGFGSTTARRANWWRWWTRQLVHLLLLARRRKAPDYARTVDIHRKPGYDPVELFLDPSIRIPQLSIGWRLAKRTLGMRTLMDVIPLDASLVKGSHGRNRRRRRRCGAYQLGRGVAARPAHRRYASEGSDHATCL